MNLNRLVSLRLWKRRLPAALVLLGGTILSVVLFVVVRDRERQRIRLDFRVQTANLEIPVLRSIDAHVEVLEAIRNFYAGSITVEGDEFEKFNRSWFASRPGIQAIAWTPRVPAANLAEHMAEAQTRYRLPPGYRVRRLDGQLIDPKEVTERRDLFPVMYLQPASRTEEFWGKDLSLEPVCRRSMDQACDTGAAIAARPEQLVPSAAPWFDLLIFLPVYDNQRPPADVADRRELLQGFAVVLVDLDALAAAAIHDLERRGIELRLVDEEQSPPVVLYDSAPTAENDYPLAPPSWLPETEKPFLLGGRRCLLACRASPGFVAERQTWQALAALGGGLLFSLLLAALVGSHTHRVARVQELVEQRTSELQRTNDQLAAEIRERIQTEAALKESQGLYHSLVENLPQNITRKDAAGRFTFANQRFCAAVGRSIDEILGKTDADLYPPEQAAKYRADDLSVMETGRNVEAIEKDCTPDGATRFVQVVKTPLRTAAGEVVGTQCLSWDVTGHRRAVERLELQHAAARVLAESSSLAEAIPRILQALCESSGWEWGAVWGRDRKANVLRCEEVYCLHPNRFPQFAALSRRTTFPPGVGLPGRVWANARPACILDVTVDDNFPRKPAALLEGLHGAFGFPIHGSRDVLGVVEFFSHEIRQPDASLVAVLDAIGRQIGQFIERKLAEEALVRSEMLFRQVWESSIDGMRLTDGDGTVTRVNSAYCRMSQMAKEDLEGKPFTVNQSPESRSRSLERYRLRFAQRSLPPHVEREVVMWNGIKGWFALSNSFVELHGEKPLVLSIFRDVSERRKSEEQLRRTAEELQRSNEQLTQLAADLEAAAQSERRAYLELQKTQAHLVQSEKLAALGQMVAGVAHEINNPLAYVGNNIAVLQRDAQELRRLLELYRRADDAIVQLRPDLAADIADLAGRIDLSYTLENLNELMDRSRDGVKRIEQIVNDLRDFARLDESELYEMDVNAGVQSTLNLVRGRASREGVELEADLAPLTPILCYPAKVNQVVLNLVVNALDACMPGGKVLVRTRPAANGVSIEVLDSGRGVPASIRDRIFDPFFTTKPPGKGTGLGLSISYRIVADHGGRITVGDSPWGGALLAVHLPIKPPTVHG